jgi:hypothetical protein
MRLDCAIEYNYLLFGVKINPVITTCGKAHAASECSIFTSDVCKPPYILRRPQPQITHLSQPQSSRPTFTEITTKNFRILAKDTNEGQYSVK